ncbi:MAG: NAD-dependent epimerase/dehydratase family protein [Acidimicrobiales bacterium]
MRVCLTGATGFIGPYVLERLLARGDDVRVLVLPETLASLRDPERVTIVEGGLDDPGAVREATRGVEVVYHLAGLLPGAEREELFRINVGGTERLLDSAKDAHRFVFTSSVAVYRPAPWPFMWPITETHPLAAHGNDDLLNYGQSKIDAEGAVVRWQADHGREYVILRPTGVYGVGAPYAERLLSYVQTRPWWSWAPWATRGWPGVDQAVLADFGAMQWVHATDLAEAVVQAGSVPAAANQVFTIAGSEVFSNAGIAAVLWVSAAQLPLPPNHGLPKLLKFDISKAHRLLGFSPQVTLRTGLAEMLPEPPAAGAGWRGVWQAPWRQGARQAPGWLPRRWQPPRDTPGP